MHPVAALMITERREQELLAQRVHLLDERPPASRDLRPPRRFDFRVARRFGLVGS
ncbi:MAG TPA: hypothetical protein VF364_09395 [Candidatus Limnocylindria bacterium]